MADYELTCIFEPQTDNKKLIKKIDSWLKEMGAKVKKKEEWGEKELAYRINKNSQGFYFFWEFEVEPSKVKTLSPKINLESGIMRHLLVRQT